MDPAARLSGLVALCRDRVDDDLPAGGTFGEGPDSFLDEGIQRDDAVEHDPSEVASGDDVERLRKVDVANMRERRRNLDLVDVSAKRSISRGADCSPTMRTRPPRRVAAIAACGASVRPEASMTTWAPSPPVAARINCARSPSSHRGRDRLRGCAVRVARRRCRRRSAGEIPFAAAAPTMKEPIPPTPMTTHAWPGERRAPHCVECDRERLRHRRSIVRAVVRNLAADAAGDVTSSARPPFSCKPSVQYVGAEVVRPARHHSQ